MSRDWLYERRHLFLSQSSACVSLHVCLRLLVCTNRNAVNIIHSSSYVGFCCLVIQTQRRDQKLKESCDKLQGKVNELKTEKNEHQDEKLKLKAETEKLEDQVKALSTHLAF
ncbi:hypothetical protein Pfo_013058 [Paulownia fortunei]|nr:hypothetical protein Pfo_013058 [Paulownia fortunei]